MLPCLLGDFSLSIPLDISEDSCIIGTVERKEFHTMRKVGSVVSEKFSDYFSTVTFTTDKNGEYLTVFYRTESKEIATASIMDNYGMKIINRYPKWIKKGFEEWLENK